MLKRTLAGVTAAGLLLVGILLAPAQHTAAASSTVLLATVKVASTVANQYVELSNNTANPIPMNSWQVCTSKVCDTFSRELKPSLTVRITSSELAKWTSSGGPSQQADFVCIVDDKGTTVDCINWGAVNQSWPNLGRFKTVGPIIDPGLSVPSTTGKFDLLVFRTRTTQTVDDDKLDQWVIRAVTQGSTGGSATPTTKPTATPVAGRAGQTPGGTVPQTGAEFPVFIVVAALLMLLAVRYLRNVRVSRH